MIKTENDYAHYKINYLTIEVLQAFKPFFMMHNNQKSIDRLCTFIERNNLYITIDELMQIPIGNSPALMELATLSNIKSILMNTQNPSIIKTPKMSTLYFRGAELKFKDDLLIEFNSIKSFKSISTLYYKNDELICCKTSNKYFGTEDNIVTKYFYNNHDVSIVCTVSTVISTHGKNKRSIRSSELKTYIKGTDIIIKECDSSGSKFEFCLENGFSINNNIQKYHWDITENNQTCYEILKNGTKKLFCWIELHNGNITSLNYENSNNSSNYFYIFKEGLYPYLERVYKEYNMNKNINSVNNFTYFDLKLIYDDN